MTVLARGATALTGGHPRAPEGPEPPAAGLRPAGTAGCLTVWRERKNGGS